MSWKTKILLVIDTDLAFLYPSKDLKTLRARIQGMTDADATALAAKTDKTAVETALVALIEKGKAGDVTKKDIQTVTDRIGDERHKEELKEAFKKGEPGYSIADIMKNKGGRKKKTRARRSRKAARKTRRRA